MAVASVEQAGRMVRHGVTSARDISVNGPHLAYGLVNSVDLAERTEHGLFTELSGPG